MPSPAPFKILSIIPPMTQLNTPYPSTAYLTGFLRSRGFDAVQEDLALATVLALLNRQGLTDLRDAALALPVEDRSGPVNFFLDHFADYAQTIDPVIAFLQGRDSTLSHRIAGRGFCLKVPALSPWTPTKTTAQATQLAGPLAPWGRPTVPGIWPPCI